MRILLYRIFQTVMRAAAYFLPWHKPELLEGENSLSKLPEFLITKGLTSVLIVTDRGIMSIGLMNGLLRELDAKGFNYTVYDKTVPNPTTRNIEEALQLYKAYNHQAIIAFGGGSPIDCAKGVGARVARPGKSIPEMKGLLKVGRKLPPLVAIPTTAGTGSEVTLAAVVSDPETHQKYALMDNALIPRYAVLDPSLMLKLPPHITSTTGMDALTHAVEAYIGRANTRETKQLSKQAVKLIFDNLFEAYTNGTNIVARANMQKASYYAGIAFTRAYVGNVHAIAHALGGFYGIPHGLANAVVLPYVLEYYKESVFRPLAELADLIGITGENHRQKAIAFIEAVKWFSERMNIQKQFSEIQTDDIPQMAQRAFDEANPIYPVPKVFSKADFEALFARIQAS